MDAVMQLKVWEDEYCENPHKFNTPTWFAFELMLGKDVEHLKKLSGWKKFERSK
jgi:hypothetical protein